MKQAVGLRLERCGLPRLLAWADMRQAVGLKKAFTSHARCSNAPGSQVPKEFCKYAPQTVKPPEKVRHVLAGSTYSRPK